MSQHHPILESFLNNALTKFKIDTRFIGVAVAGSWITKTTDEFSDLDLIIVCEENAYEQVQANKRQIAASLGDLVEVFTAEHVGEPRMVIALYDNPVLHVDLKFIKLSDLEKRIENPTVVWERDQKLTKKMAATEPSHPMPDLQWIEDRFWIWVHYAATKLGRGEYFEVMDFLSYLRSHVLGPLSLVKHGQLPRGARRLETHAPEDLADFKKTVPTHDHDSCFKATEASIALYKKLRDQSAHTNFKRNERAEKVALKYLESVRR